METLPPKISVLMSVCNGLRFIEHTVNGILGQNYEDFEFVILDNGSTDGTREYLQKAAALAARRIRLILDDQDLGHSGSLNRGLEACRGEWIARIDGDAVALPNRLDRQLSFVDANPDVAVTCCLAYYINEKGKRKARTFLDLTTREKFRECMEKNEVIVLPHSCVFMRRDVVMKVGGYREAFGCATDIDLWNRISEQRHLILVQPEFLMERHVHSAASSPSEFLDFEMKYEWVRACMIARRSGKPEPGWAEFLKAWEHVGRMKRLNRQRKTYAKMYYRLGGENFIGSNKIKGAVFFALAALLRPRYALRRLAGQMLLNKTNAKIIGSAMPHNEPMPAFARAPVTVIIACHNAVAYIRQAIDSCLRQTQQPEEIIVVDDASTDGSAAVLNEFARAGRVRLLRNESNMGRDVSVNRALEYVRTKYIALLDADDVALPARFEKQVAFMKAHSRCGCSSSFVFYFNESGEKIARGTLDILTEEDFQRYVDTEESIGLYCPSVILRAEIFKDPSLRLRKEFWPASDIDLWNRIAETGWQVLAQPEFLTAYRIHGTSAVTSNSRNTRLQYEWARACMRARRRGKPEPPRNEFMEELSNAPALKRFNRWRKSEAKVAYRAAGFAVGEREKLTAARHLLRAFCLQPLYVSKRLARQIFDT